MQEQQKPFKLHWVFLKHGEAIVQIPVRQYYNFVECWYEDMNGNVYDPFFVHECKNMLIDRLDRRWFEYLNYSNQKDILLAFTKKLLKRYY